MDLDAVLAQVKDIFVDVLDEDDIEISYETTADEVEDWDSLTHIQLVVAIEKHFAIEFTSSEIQSYANVGQMCDAIVAKKK